MMSFGMYAHVLPGMSHFLFNDTSMLGNGGGNAAAQVI